MDARIAGQCGVSLLAGDRDVESRQTSVWRETLLVPPGVKDMTDGVEYMLEIYKERYGRGATVEGAFIFLKENNVRANFVESLKKTIMEFLERSAI